MTASTADSTAELDQLKRALLTMRALRERLDRLERTRTEPIAIVGIGLRFPGGATNPESFWRLLRDGVDAIREVPTDRWDADTFFSADPNAAGRMPSRFGGFIEDIDLFDPHFFGISPREAASMDPQQRLMLEVAWEALEDAGHAPSRLSGSRTGVFIGMGLNDYGRLQVPGQAADPTQVDTYFSSGNALCITANRISYVLDLHGPSAVIDTACSSSLVAVHVACHSLRNGDCDLALVGGVNVMLAPATSLSVAKLLAPDGRCKVFDSRANGYVRAEGAAIVVLKPLNKAIAAGDSIYAVIRGSAVNQDGYSSGLTVPNGVAQQALLRTALENAGVKPEHVAYVEAHGTGTSLGDPIEANALGAVLGSNRPSGQPLAIGSVKSNIGHLEAAAGIAGLVKVALALKHGQIPPSLHFETPNPLIAFDDLSLQVQQTLATWPRQGTRPIAGVSSFGFGGTNAHVLLEAGPDREPSIMTNSSDRPSHVLVLSGKSPEALRTLAGRFAAFLAEQPSLALADVCYSANTGRSQFEHRLAVIGDTPAEVADRLTAVARNHATTGAFVGRADGDQPARIVFLFSGQGTQSVNMGRGLYETQPTFRATLERCAELLAPELDQPLLNVLYPPAGGEDAAKATLDQTAYTQPALFAVEYALAELWRSWGVEPAVLLGHSVGELVAACVAGVYALEEGLALVTARGRLMQELPAGGAMTAIFAEPAAVQAAVAPYAGRVALAAINGPRHVVIAGTDADVTSISGVFQAQGVRVQPLLVSHAFHSPLVEPMLDSFEQFASGLHYAPPRLPLVSTLTGTAWRTGAGPDAQYWRRHARDAVQFAAGVRTAHEIGARVFVEIGPHPTLLGMARECVADDTAAARLWLPSLRRGREDTRQVLESLGQLYAQGATVDWAGFDRQFARQHVRMPTYPFQRQRYWFKQPGQPPVAAGPAATADSRHPLLGRPLRSPALSGHVFEAAIGRQWPPFLDEHRVHGQPVFPAAAYVEVVHAAAMEIFGGAAGVMDELVIQQPLVLPPEGTRLMQVVVSPRDDGVAGVQVFSQTDGGGSTTETGQARWSLHAAATIRSAADAAHEDGQLVDDVGPASLLARPSDASEVPVADFYTWLDDLGMGYGPTFRGIEQLWRGDDEAVGRVRLAGAPDAAGAYTAHPALLDACLQVIAALVGRNQSRDTDAGLYVPVALRQLTLRGPLDTAVWSHVSLLAPGTRGTESLAARVRVVDAAGHTVLDVGRVDLRHARRELVVSGETDSGLYEVRWELSSLAAGALRANAIPRRWLIFADSTGVGRALVEHLGAAGAECCVIRPGESLETCPDGSWVINPLRPEHFRQMLEQVLANGQTVDGIVHLWSLETDRNAPLDAPVLDDAQALGCASVLHLVQALALGGSKPQLWLATRGAQSVAAGERLAIAQAPLLGLARTIRQEFPNLGCVSIDLDPTDSAGAADCLLETILADDSEDEVAYRAGARHVARLVARQTPPQAGASQPQTTPEATALRASDSGVLDRLELVSRRRAQPLPGEVEIQVRAAGLNFRDVLKALNLYPGEAGPLGDECAGTITAVGRGVVGLQVGEQVVAIASGSLGNYVTTPAHLVVRRPSGLDDPQAATLPIAYATARYALEHLAQLRPGERVLVHAAAGGVGLAAVHLAQRAGAEVIGTAGSPAKRAYLRSLGVEHVFDSRSLDFAEQIRAETDGQGVDVVLNSLTGEFIPASLAVLKRGGRFLEIGKRGIWEPEQVASLGRDIQYFVVYLGAVFEQEPAVAQELLRSIVDGVDAGILTPLPVRSFSIQDSVDAFRFMAQAKHIGKIALVVEPLRGGRPGAIRPDATYLVTGGLRGLGLEVARDIVSQGGRHLVLVSRGEAGPDSSAVLKELEAQGARVLVTRADVARLEDMQRVVGAMQATMPPLRGVVHAAGVVEDGVLMHQDWAGFERVLSPKVQGAWNLDALTADCPLDFFVLFSAGASLLGLPGQANYAAANAFLDALAHHRRAQGLTALSINWGPWADVGMAAALDDGSRRRLAARGLRCIRIQDGLAILRELLRTNASHVAVLPIDWAAYARSLSVPQPQLLVECVRQARLIHPARLVEESTRIVPDLVQQLRSAPRSRHRGMLLRYVRDQVGTVLELDPARLSPQRPLSDFGLDSLMAVELRNALATGLQLDLSVTLLFDYPTIDDLTDHLLGALRDQAGPPGDDTDTRFATGAVVGSRTIREIQQLSESEAELLLLSELANARSGH